MKTDPKAAVFWVGVGGAAWKPAKQVLVGKLKEQGGRAVSSELQYVTASLQGLAPGYGLKSNQRTSEGFNSNSVVCSLTQPFEA